MQPATLNLKPTNLKPPTLAYGPRYANNLQPATYNLQPATCNLQPSTLNLQSFLLSYSSD
ncbi:MAG: restriction endonuclease [Moorea sp. SIO4G2]|nr:restriction endonuclease [Moorena sp. SIO4G2]